MNGKKCTIWVFSLILTVGLSGLLFLPKNSFSMAENRVLADFPQFTLPPGENPAAQAESYLQDHFPLRSSFLALRTNFAIFSGRREVNGVYILDGQMAEQFGSVSEARLAQSLAEAETFAKSFSGPVSLMLIPTSVGIDRDLLPASITELSQKALLDRVYESVSERLGTIDCYSLLAANHNKPLYYRSDHRWTTLGAYFGYSACGEQMGFVPLAAERFNIQHASHNFRGSLYHKTLYAGPSPDTIDIYSASSSTLAPTVETYRYDEGSQLHDGLYYRELLGGSDPYALFLGEPAPVVTITTGLKKAPRLLVIRDEYANVMAPFLALHYSTVTLVDPTLLEGPLESLVNLDDYDQALLCYSLKHFACE